MSAGVVEGEVENNSFGDRGNCKCPPYTIQTEAGLSEDHGKWDSGTGEDNADDTAKLCHTKTGKCADGHKLNGHKGFAESDDDQIVDRNRQNIFFVEKREAIGPGRNTKAPVTMSPQTARILNEILYPFRIRSGFFAP